MEGTSWGSTGVRCIGSVGDFGCGFFCVSDTLEIANKDRAAML
jgi:hypothetical protein